MIKWRYCKAMREATEYDGSMSWSGFKQFLIGFGGPEGGYLTVCFRGGIGKACQHVRLTEDEADWFFKNGQDVLDRRVKKHMEEDKKEQEEKAKPTKEQSFQQELEQRRQTLERERAKKARKLATRLWGEVTKGKGDVEKGTDPEDERKPKK